MHAHKHRMKMNKREIVTYSTIVLMILFLVSSFLTKDVIMSKLMASFGIVAGAYTFHYFSKQNSIS